MSKHTPGPWYWNGKTLIGDRRKLHLMQAEESPGLGFAAEANARLIAAAPELLALVRDYRGAIEFHIRRDLRDGDVEGANLKRLTLQYVEDAIAKAEGRS